MPCMTAKFYSRIDRGLKDKMSIKNFTKVIQPAELDFSSTNQRNILIAERDKNIKKYARPVGDLGLEQVEYYMQRFKANQKLLTLFSYVLRNAQVSV